MEAKDNRPGLRFLQDSEIDALVAEIEAEKQSSSTAAGGSSATS